MRQLASKSVILALVALAAVLSPACSSQSPQQPAPQPAPAPAKAAEPEVPADVQTAAESALGAEVTVLAHGDLSLSGRPQILAANLLKTTPRGVVPGTLFSRLVVLGKESAGKDKAHWKELLLVSTHLRNQNGYLGGTPFAPINGWRLQKETDSKKGLVMYFTPIHQPPSGNVRPIAVLWNPKVKRYQSQDINYENFLGEVKSLQ